MKELKKEIWAWCFLHKMKEYARTGSPSCAENHCGVASSYADECLRILNEKLKKVANEL